MARPAPARRANLVRLERRVRHRHAGRGHTRPHPNQVRPPRGCHHGVEPLPLSPARWHPRSAAGGSVAGPANGPAVRAAGAAADHGRAWGFQAIRPACSGSPSTPLSWRDRSSGRRPILTCSPPRCGPCRRSATSLAIRSAGSVRRRGRRPCSTATAGSTPACLAPPTDDDGRRPRCRGCADLYGASRATTSRPSAAGRRNGPLS